ncbi:MAG: acetyl-CoA carboxylase biotin carboxyl carrier protein [Bdellovibrionota bacterium]
MSKKQASNALARPGKSDKLGRSGLSSVDYPEIDQLDKILDFMNRGGVVELEWQHGDKRLVLKTGTPARQAASTTVAIPDGAKKTSKTGDAAIKSEDAASAAGCLPANQKHVLSPFVGTFYRAPSPTTEPYVKENQLVKRGDVLCIIEAMKLMNEIEADFPGKVLSTLVENGQPVEYGEPLFIMEVV